MALRYFALLLFCVVAATMPRNAGAAQKALFLLDNFSHWIDYTYQYEGMQLNDGGRKSSSTSQNMNEGYGLTLDYAIYNQHILKGNLGGRVNFEQRESTTTTTSRSNQIDLQYNVNGTILDRSFFPATFYSSMETNYIQEPFLPSYNLTTDNRGISLSINNAFIPVMVTYSDSTSETSGLALNRKQETDSISLSVQNNLFSVSQTSLSLTGTHGRNSDGGVESAANSTTSFKVTNSLSFPSPERYRNLYSLLQLDKTKYLNERSTLLWNETLTWDLGRALRSQVNYQMIVRDTNRIREESNRLGGSVSHRLFESLFTEVSGQVQKISQTGGSERGWSAALNLTYQKKLPRESLLRLTYQHQYDLVDRDQTNQTTSVVDEPQTFSSGVPMFLKHPDVVPESVVVRNANQATRPTPYLPAIDYAVRSVGQLAEIVILPGSAIRAGDNLLVSYDYHVNPRIKFDTTLQSVGADLWLFDNRYRVYGKMDFYRQDLLSGKDDQVRLNNGAVFHAGFEGYTLPMTFQIKYDRYDLDFDKHDSVEARAQYTRNFHRSSFSANINDSYTVTRPNSYTGSANSGNISVNTIGGGGTYTRDLFSTAFMSLSANYFNTQGKDISRDQVSCRFDFRWNYGKLQFSLFGQSNWRFEAQSSGSDASVQLQLRRYF